jgi:hypothetical protein
MHVSALPRFALVFATVLSLGVSAPADARKKKGQYTDTKKRFALELPSGWRLAPMPGDTSGMVFKKDVDGAFGLFRVSVRKIRAGETLSQSLNEALRPFAAEIGYTPGPELPASIGLFSGLRRPLTVYASGDRRTVRAVELHVTHAFGHVHTIHFEALEKDRPRFSRDTERMVASYRPMAGRSVVGKLVGRWENQAGGPTLLLDEQNLFSLGELNGTWSSDGGRLQLHVAEGTETYRMKLKGRSLTLSSPNLDEPMRYRRSGAARFEKDSGKKTRAAKLTREELIGRWKVIDQASSDPLVLHLAPSGSVAFGPMSGSWRYKRGLLTIRSTAGETVTYTISKDGAYLVLGGGDLDRDMRLVRE